MKKTPVLQILPLLLGLTVFVGVLHDSTRTRAHGWLLNRGRGPKTISRCELSIVYLVYRGSRVSALETYRFKVDIALQNRRKVLILMMMCRNQPHHLVAHGRSVFVSYTPFLTHLTSTSLKTGLHRMLVVLMSKSIVANVVVHPNHVRRRSFCTCLIFDTHCFLCRLCPNWVFICTLRVALHKSY